MGIRFRKSIKIAPGVKISLNKKSAGLSLGTKGVRYTLNSSGKRTATVGIPGTGMSYSATSSSRKAVKSHTNYYNNEPALNGYEYKPVGLSMLLITIFLGPLGVHKFVQGKIGFGILYFFTFGILGFGWLFDCIFTLIRFIQSVQNKPIPEQYTNTQYFDLTKDFDSMDGHEFEYYCADLLRKNNFENVEVTQGSGDYGIDILAEKEDISYAIQCKCYSENIGNKAVQEAYSGKSYYNCMIGAVLTNRFFTPAAQETAEQNKILLWDRTYLENLIANA